MLNALRFIEDHWAILMWTGGTLIAVIGFYYRLRFWQQAQEKSMGDLNELVRDQCNKCGENNRLIREHQANLDLHSSLERFEYLKDIIIENRNIMQDELNWVKATLVTILRNGNSR